MPKDNEVDEKAQTEELIRRLREVLGANGSGPETTLLARAQYHAATVAELRAEVERLRKSNELYSFAMNTAGIDELKRRADAAERRVGELEADARELREELEQSQRDYALLANESIYDGNSIGWIASKAKNYGDALLLAWGAVKEVGGTCDGNTPLHEAIRKQLTKADK